MIGIIIVINIILTSILAFTHWLAVKIKSNPYLTSLAVYNTSLCLIFLTIKINQYSPFNEKLKLIFLITHCIITSILIYQSWKEEELTEDLL